MPIAAARISTRLFSTDWASQTTSARVFLLKCCARIWDTWRGWRPRYTSKGDNSPPSVGGVKVFMLATSICNFVFVRPSFLSASSKAIFLFISLLNRSTMPLSFQLDGRLIRHLVPCDVSSSRNPAFENSWSPCIMSGAPSRRNRPCSSRYLWYSTFPPGVFSWR